MAVRPRRISDIKPILTNLAQTSHYEVKFGSLPIVDNNYSPLRDYLLKKGITSTFISENAGLLCYNASLPTTNLASSTIVGNFMGIQEKFAHSRVYDEISLDFYVDKNYQMLIFLESWMEFISSGSFIDTVPENKPVNQNQDGYFVRMQYPAYYKLESTKIIKFDRDYRREIEYNFRGLYPRSISSIPIAYANSDTLKVSATFSYDRYIAGKANRIDEINNDNNNETKNKSQNTESPKSPDEIYENISYVPISGSNEVINNLTPNPLPENLF